MARRKKQGLAKLWQLVTLLDATGRGLTAPQLMERMGVSRSTVYRYLGDLEVAGVGVEKNVVNGETRYRLLGARVPAVVPTARQLAALHFAREALGSLEGTELVEQLDALLGRWAARPRESLQVSRRTKAQGRDVDAVLRRIDEALRRGRRLALEYRGVKDASVRSREVDPLALHVDHDVVYLLGYDHGAADYRVFKVARVASAAMLETPVRDHSALEVRDTFARSVKAWQGAAAGTVVVRLSAKVARFAREYPLMADQETEVLGDGSVLVSEVDPRFRTRG